MKAITFQDVRTLACETVPDPALRQATDALVRVELCAICGSDLHVYHGRERGLDRGTVMGHEFIGEVVDVGREVRELTRGQRVLSPFTTCCGRCFHCVAGLTSRCTSGQLFGWVAGGRGLHGAQAEYVRVPLADSTLIPIPAGLSPEEALLLGDVLPTGYFCARQAGCSPGGVYAVLGCGPVGLSAIVGALELGAERVFAVDRVAERLERARMLGAVPLHLDHDDPAGAIGQAGPGGGADAVLEVVGSAPAHRLAIDLVRAGGTISVVGVHNGNGFAFTPVEAYDKNLTYRVGRCPAHYLARQLIPLVQQGRYPLASLFSHRLPLSHGVEGYRLFDEKRDGCTKVALFPDG